MGLFGRSKLTEVEVSQQFSLMVIGSIKENWPQISRDLTVMLRDDDFIPDDQRASFDFFLAVVALQMRALPNLFPSHQAKRLRDHVIGCISSGDNTIARSILEYDTAWDKCLQRGDMPVWGLAAVLYDRIKCHAGSEYGDFVSPVTLVALSQAIVSIGPGWWKFISEEYKIVQ